MIRHTDVILSVGSGRESRYGVQGVSVDLRFFRRLSCSSMFVLLSEQLVARVWALACL